MIRLLSMKRSQHLTTAPLRALSKRPRTTQLEILELSSASLKQAPGLG